MVRVLITAPKRVRPNETFPVKLLIGHPMESGQRRDTMGQAIARDIIHTLSVTMSGDTVFQATLYPAIAANPYFAFPVRAARSGALVVRFTDDHDITQTETWPIEVAADA